jgi:hypothetical protein
MTRPSTPYLRGQRIDPQAISGRETAADLIDNAFLAYNAGRLREARQLFTQRMLHADTTVGMSLTGAMTPAGLGMSVLIPLMEAGFVDWIISTGANLYHDAHFALGLALHRGRHDVDDVEPRQGVVRIYDIFFRLQCAAVHRCVRPGSVGPRGIPAPDEHRGVSLPARRLRPRAGAGAGAFTALGAGGRPRIRRADLHLGARRQLDRDERGRASAGGEPAPVRRQRRRERNRGHRARGQADGWQERRADRGWREPEELHPADRAANPGSPHGIESAATTTSFCR